MRGTVDTKITLTNGFASAGLVGESIVVVVVVIGESVENGMRTK